jgi:gp178
MNIQGLIERYEKFKASKKKMTSVDLVLKDLRSLDKPEPLPFKLKDVVGRIRGFDPTTQTRWLNGILKELGDDYGSMKYREGYEQGKFEGEWVGNQLKDADKVRKELNKPVIPQFVADWIEECKAKGKNLLRALLYTPEKVNSWVDDPDNQEIFALAWMFGYTVENEKRYTVVMKETKQPLYYNAVDKKLFFSMGGLATNFTQQQLEKLNFGWIFFCPWIEIEEVQDET